MLSDKKALCDLYNRISELVDILQDLRNLSEATLRYNFTIEYLPGKLDVIVDFLS